MSTKIETTLREVERTAPDVFAAILSGELDICKVADIADRIISYGETLKDCVKKKAAEVGSISDDVMSIAVRYDNKYDYTTNPEITELETRLKALKSDMLQAYKNNTGEVMPVVSRKDKPTITITRIKH